MECSAAQKLINECRKSGLLPLDICCDDERRSADGLEEIDEDRVEDHAAGIINYIRTGHRYYTPVSFWEDQNTYIEMAVEKVDLKSLFAPVCESFRIPVRNVSGWSDINSRAAMMRRFADREAKGKTCVLLSCGDHDPGGLHFSDRLRSNLTDLEAAVGWSPGNLVIDRFGLDFDSSRRRG